MYLSTATTLMGQKLLEPPTVSGWDTGREWIDGGILTERVNFAVNEVGDVTKPGVREIVERVSNGKKSMSSEDLLKECLDLLGPLEFDANTQSALLKDSGSEGELWFDTDANREQSVEQISRMLQLVVSTIDYQFA